MSVSYDKSHRQSAEVYGDNEIVEFTRSFTSNQSDNARDEYGNDQGEMIAYLLLSNC